MLYTDLQNIYRNDELFRGYLQRIISSWNKNVQLHSYRYHDRGRMACLFLLNVQLSEKGDQRLILRVCLDDYSKFQQNFGRQMKLMSLFEENNYGSGVRIYYSDESKKIFPFKYEILEYVPGKTIDRNSNITYFEKLGTSLAELHSIKMEHFGFGNSLQEGSAEQYYCNYYLDALEKGKNIDCKITKQFEKIFDTFFYKCEFDQMHPLLIHHDIHAKNIMIRKNGVLTIVDWDSARGGIPQYDFIKLKYINSSYFTDSQKRSIFDTYKRNGGSLDFKLDCCIYEICWLYRMYIYEKSFPYNSNYYPTCDYYRIKFKDFYNNFVRYVNQYQSDSYSFFTTNI